jgi:hypothetical protein
MRCVPTRTSTKRWLACASFSETYQAAADQAQPLFLRRVAQEPA